MAIDKKASRKEVDLKTLTSCEATEQMLRKARRDGVETAFDRALNMKACPIGADSACCKHCAMGPCRLNSRDPYGKVGVCGATIDTIMARNFARMVATGTASHTDHAMAMLALFREVAEGRIKEYTIRNPQKLERTALGLGIDIEGKPTREIALAVCDELEKTFTQVEGEIPLVKRAPKKTLEIWRKHNLVPRGAMREIMEMMNRTHMGVDQHYENIVQQCSRTALADGWGGSMVATEISDILFGTPVPVAVEVNMGVLKEDQVNIIIHGHEPNLFESMITSVSEPTFIQAAKEAGAKGINLVGMCCSGSEMMVRHGIPHAGNFMSTEAVLVTGAVDAFTVDIQCIKQGLAQVAECYKPTSILTRVILKPVPTISSSGPSPGLKPGPCRLKSPRLSIPVCTGSRTITSIKCWAALSGLLTPPLTTTLSTVVSGAWPVLSAARTPGSGRTGCMWNWSRN